MKSDDLDFDLPPELIAQSPASERARSRLLRYRRKDHSIEHHSFADLPSLLQKGDLLVVNDARVLPARFMLQKPTGGRVEGLFISETAAGRWRVMLKNLGPVRAEMKLQMVGSPDQFASVIAKKEEGEYELQLDGNPSAIPLLQKIGRMPLPPYIKREKGQDERDAMDQERYQTVYARTPGSVAAPTAGLHFDQSIFQQLDQAGVARTSVTLNVGMGTFKPISAELLDDHVMHSESYEISADSAERINLAQAEHRRIIAVGTTACRVLESQPADRAVEARTGETSIFIRPPYEWKRVGALVTNFHLPRSTLIALVAAKVGIEEQRRIYRIAIEQKYRFFSYGDAMLIE